MPNILIDLEQGEDQEVEEAMAAWEYERTRPPEVRIELNPALIAEQAGYELDPWQDRFLRSEEKRILLNCSRQIGKSSMAAVKAIHRGMYQPRSLILLLSAGQRQSSELFQKVRDTYAEIGKPVVSESETALQLRLQNGSRIVALPGNAGRIRGYSGASMIIIDEAAWVPDDLYRAVRPMLAVSNGDLIAMSTPWGRRGWWFDAWESEQDWERYEVTAYECPRITDEFLAEEKEALGPDFDSEYLCQFTSSSATVFDALWFADGRNRYLLGTKENRNKVVARFLSFDTAMKDKDTSDYTGCLIGELTKDYRLRVRHVWRERLRFPDLIARIEETYVHEAAKDSVGVTKVLIEDRASGTSAYQTLVAGTQVPQLARNVVPYNPGNLSKRARGSLAAVWCRRDRVELPYPDEDAPWLHMFERELFGFTGTDQDEHDDMVDTFTQLILYLEANKVLSTGWYKALATEKEKQKAAGFTNGQAKRISDKQIVALARANRR